MDDVDMIDLTTENVPLQHIPQHKKQEVAHSPLIASRRSRSVAMRHESNPVIGGQLDFPSISARGNNRLSCRPNSPSHGVGREASKTLSPGTETRFTIAESDIRYSGRLQIRNANDEISTRATNKDIFELQQNISGYSPRAGSKSFQAAPLQSTAHDNGAREIHTKIKKTDKRPENASINTETSITKPQPAQTSIEISDDELDNSSRTYEKVVSMVKDHQNLLQDANQALILLDEEANEEQELITEGVVTFSGPLSQFEDDDDLQIIKVTGNTPSRLVAYDKRRISNGVQFDCSSGKCVEFTDGGIVRILKIVIDSDRKEYIVGQLFVRHNEFSDRKWPRRHNELVLTLRIKDGKRQSLVKKPLDEVVGNRHLIITNQAYSVLSARNHQGSFADVQKNKKYGPLFARWKQTYFVDRAGKTLEQSIERLSFDDADSDARIEDSQSRLQWRDRVIPGGEHFYQAPYVERNGHSYTQSQKYAFGDTFCGGGGASCGADQAGLFVQLGVDINEKAVETYKLNFESKGASCRSEDIHDFIRMVIESSGDYQVDVLHMSPPCQPFSPAHTVANELRDEVNEAAIFSVGELLRLLKPRVATLEETFGLQNRHRVWFDALIKMFIDVGYSIRWKIAKLEEYGLPQKRRRLLIIAAGPGEVLPCFPKITHSETERSLRPLRTIEDAIGNIPPRSSVSHHNIEAARYPPGHEKIPYSANTQAKTITTSGGIGNHHPSGSRMFTIRELAALQNFPLTFKFPNIGVTELRRQIGNAVPPYVFKKIYREIIMSLKRTDGVL